MQAELFVLSVLLCGVWGICSPKNLNFVDFPESPKRSKPFVIGVTAIKCPGMTELHYKWEVKEVPGDIVQNDDRPTITIDGYKYNSKNIFTNAFNVTVWLSHYPDMSASSSTSKVFHFNSDKMHLEVKGGSEKTHPFKTPLIIDAKSLSRDFSFSPNENAFNEHSISWKIEPPIPGFTPPESLRFTVPAKFLSLNQVYRFQLQVKRSKIFNPVDIQQASQTVTIIDQGLPEINIICKRNCLNPNVQEVTTLSVTCSKNCEDVHYKWTTQPELDADWKDLGDENDALVILPGAFNPGEKVTISVQKNSSLSTYSMVFMSRMTKGTCDITPKEGVSGITLFKVECKEFSSTVGGLLYKVYQKSGAEKSDIMLSKSKSSTENYIYLAEGSPAEIVVRVQDDIYLQEEVQLQVLVKPFTLKPNTSALNVIKALTLNDKSNSVVSLTAEGRRNTVVQMVSYLLDMINKIGNISDSEKKDLHKHMAESFIRLSPRNFESAEQLISILTKLEKFKLSTDTYTSRLLGKSILQSVLAVHDITNHKGDSSIPALLLYNFAQSVIVLLSSLMKRVPEIEIELQQSIAAHDYDSYDEMVGTKLQMRDDLRELTDSILISLLIIGSSFLRKSVPNEKAIVLESEMLAFMTRRVHLRFMLSNPTITLSNVTESKVIVSKSLIRNLQEKYSFADYQFAVLQTNPFWWHQNSSRINTEIVHFDLLYDCRRISLAKKPFYVYLKTKSVPVGVLNGTISGAHVIAHRMEMGPDFFLVVVFEASSDTYKVASSDCYCSEEDFAGGIEIRGNANESERTLTVRPSKNEKVVYVCVKSSGSTLNYEGSFSAFSCVHWDLKAGKLDSKGCKVQKASLKNGGLLECECTHASYYAGLILVPSDKINLDPELNIEIMGLKNWMMLIIILTSLILWLTFFMCAWYKDKQLVKENVVYKLDDNVPGDPHEYLIVIFTGMLFDAGTTADVGFQLLGEEAKSRPHLIKTEGVTLLKRNSQDWFIVNTPCYLGKLKKIRLWHNCRGRNPHWYCQRILVHHLKSGLQYCFIVEKWLSLIWGEGKTFREVTATEENDLNYTKAVLSVKMERDFRDACFWLSVFSRDTQSNFSSKERVGTTMCVFYFSMLAHVIFYGIPKNAPIDSIAPKASLFIDSHEILVLLESFAVALPVSILITFLFKNCASENYRLISKEHKRQSKKTKNSGNE